MQMGRIGCWRDALTFTDEQRVGKQQPELLDRLADSRRREIQNFCGIDDAFIRQLAAFSPLRLVFRDAGFASDAVKINAEQLLKQLSPLTEVKAI